MYLLLQFQYICCCLVSFCCQCGVNFCCGVSCLFAENPSIWAPVCPSPPAPPSATAGLNQMNLSPIILQIQCLHMLFRHQNFVNISIYSKLLVSLVCLGMLHTLSMQEALEKVFRDMCATIYQTSVVFIQFVGSAFLNTKNVDPSVQEMDAMAWP